MLLLLKPARDSRETKRLLLAEMEALIRRAREVVEKYVAITQDEALAQQARSRSATNSKVAIGLHSAPMIEKPPTPTRVFRFLGHLEFAALSQEEKVRYLKQALEAVEGGSAVVSTQTYRLASKDPE